MSVESDVEGNIGAGFEERLARELRGAATLAPDGSLFAPAAGAERLGRRRRNRRRAAMVGGAALAVLVVGGLGAFTGDRAPERSGRLRSRRCPVTRWCDWWPACCRRVPWRMPVGRHRATRWGRTTRSWPWGCSPTTTARG